MYIQNTPTPAANIANPTCQTGTDIGSLNNQPEANRLLADIAIRRIEAT
jgi:hypothetical protein